MARKRRNLLPNCCPPAREYPTVVARVNVYKGDSATNKATWRASIFESLQVLFSPSRYKSGPPAEFCTYCGEKLPELKRKKRVPKKICRVTDEGYRCDTCGKRLNECRCLPPEAAWEAKGCPVLISES